MRVKISFNIEGIPKLDVFPMSWEDFKEGDVFIYGDALHVYVNQYTWSIPIVALKRLGELVEIDIEGAGEAKEDKKPEEEEGKSTNDIDLLDLIRMVVLSDRAGNLIRLKDKGIL